MPIISEIKNSDFEPGRIQEILSINDGAEITTEGILNGWNNVEKELDEIGFFEKMKEPPFYIQEKNKA